MKQQQEDKLLYEKEPLIGYGRELASLIRIIEKHRHRDNFDFSGFTIWGGLSREVFIDDGEGMRRGLIPSNIHLKEVFELMRDLLIWRLRARDQEGWLKQLIKKPWRIW